MRIAFIADSRAQHTRHWLSYFAKIGDQVLLLSTFPGPSLPGVQTQVLSGFFRLGNTLIKDVKSTAPAHQGGFLRFAIGAASSKEAYYVWQQARALEVFFQSIQARLVLKKYHPDIVHALRLQNEGYIGSRANFHPLIISSWGSDFVSMAKHYPAHRFLTRLAIKKPDAFIADCLRDVRFAHAYGLPSRVPTRSFPGNGGIDRSLFHPGNLNARERERIIVYARGISPFARIDTLLKAAKIMQNRNPHHLSHFVLLIPHAMISIVDQMRQKLKLSTSFVRVRSSVTQAELIHLLQTAAVSVSPMESDGTPISMLEAMACGAFPVMSNLESIREWVSQGHNGLLFNPNSPEELAICLKEGLDNISMRQTAQEINMQLIRNRADYYKVMPQVRDFYQMVADSWRRGGSIL